MAQNQNSSQSPAAEGIKKSLGYAADLASLKIKLGKAKSRRKAAYTRLGELSYTKYRPRSGTDSMCSTAASRCRFSASLYLQSLLSTGIMQKEDRSE